MKLLSSKVAEISVQTAGLIDKQKQTDHKVNLIQKNIEQLGENFISEKVYHCGASSKDAGKKLCAINQITEIAIIHPVIDRLLSLPEKYI